MCVHRERPGSAADDREVVIRRAAAEDTQNGRPREYRSQRVPGQKTFAVAKRNNVRNLLSLKGGKAIASVVPMIPIRDWLYALRETSFTPELPLRFLAQGTRVSLWRH